jgi:hypothetical protein
MYRENMETSWPEISGKLLKQFPKLKASDLLFATGSEEALLRKIQLRLFKSKREVLELIGSM